MFGYGVMQQNQRDCSVACLATVIRIFGGNISMIRLRELIKVDNQGGTIFGVLEASKKVGLEAEALSGSFKEFTDEIENESIKFPCIAHVTTLEGMSHFVVLINMTKEKIELFDPGFGKKEVSYADFEKLWTGNLITFSKTNSTYLEKEDKLKPLKKYINLFEDKFSIIVIITIFSIILSISSIAVSYVYKIIIDKVILGNDLKLTNDSMGVFAKLFDYLLSNLPALLFGMLLFFGIQGIISIFRAVLVSNLSKKMNDDLYSKFINHLLKLEESFFHSRDTGEIISRYQTIMDIQQMISKVVLTVILEFFSLITASFILINININLFVLTCAMAIIYVVITLIFVKPINILNKNKIEVNGSAVMSISESIQGIETIKTEVLEEKYAIKFMKSIDKLTNYVRKEIQINNILMSIITIVESIFMLLILFKGATYIALDLLTLGSLVLFLSLVPFFILPIKNLMGIQPDIQKMHASIGKLNDILETPVEQGDLQLLSKDNDKESAIVLKSISHSYNFDNECLKEINIKIKKNEKVAIVGKSGSGKSTLLKIISSLITPEKGELLISKNINISTKKEYRERIGYISQKCDLFTGTIKDNLFLNTDEDSIEKYNDILDIIGFNDFIKTCPLGVETQVTEQGNNFSGGQKQMIVLARLVISKAHFLFLDEGTSNLDSLGEKKIIEYMTKKMANKTIISVFHNLNLAKYFDKVIVMEEGEIMGIGTHKELLKTNYIYQQLNSEKE
ncbi:ATP-binding cassette, subfamily C, bacteriocin exporter [Enterococcus sp. DIV0840]|uniref:peptidase domain-containing ABC transporter n=1 Tax=unclassified Enterococcus TaxID=2608891 RepID=UPI001A8F1B78|nr:peptidase domain-containing ABC transporter [Enterococcus sp. DIV0849a]MBO0435568.1 peptidase domain-containing ABC transporter [Enterococcus sp. DIV0849a]